MFFNTSSRVATWTLLVAVFAFPLAGLAALKALASNRNNVADWLPASYQETTEFNWFRGHFADQQFILLSWDGCTLDDPRLALLAAKLAEPVALARPPAADVAVAAAEPTGAFRPALAGRFVAADQPAAAESPGDDGQPGSVQYFSEVITGRQVLDRLIAAPTNLSRDEALDRLRHVLVGADDTTTCAVLTLSDAGERDLHATVGHLIDVAVEHCAIAPDTLHMGGPPVDNVALDDAGQRSLFRLAGLSAIIGLAISYWCVRDVRLTLLVFSSGLYAAAVSLAIVWFTSGSVNAILLTMPPLVYVAAVSGAIHLTNYYREEVTARGPDGAAWRAARHARLPLVLATITTAAGLLSLAISDLVPIRDFGIYSAAGVVASCVLVLFVLPAALECFIGRTANEAHASQAAPPAVDTDAGFEGAWRRTGEWIMGRSGWITVGLLSVMAVCALGLARVETSVSLMRFFPDRTRIVQDYAWLEHHIGPLVPMEVVLRFDETCNLDLTDRLELLRRVHERVEQLPEVGGALSAVTFSPPPPEINGPSRGVAGALRRLVVRDPERVARTVYNQRLEGHRDAFLSNGYLSAEGDHDLWRVSARIAALDDVDYGAFVGELKGEVEPLLDEYRNRGVEGITATYTGLVPLVYKAQHTLLDGLVFGFVSDLALVAVAIILSMRDLGAGGLLLLPAAFPAIIVFGLMGWSGVVIDTGTVMTPCVALGVTVDDVVHFLIWVRRGLAEGLGRREAVLLAYRHCARPMCQSWAVIGLGLSVFAFSPFNPTARFGYLMITLLSASLVGNLVLLPAMLAGPWGGAFCWLLQRRKRRESSAQALPQPALAAACVADARSSTIAVQPFSGGTVLERTSTAACSAIALDPAAPRATPLLGTVPAGTGMQSRC